jgi:hypothetical protein
MHMCYKTHILVKKKIMRKTSERLI